MVFLAGDDAVVLVSAKELCFGRSSFTDFQKRGLKAIEAAETVYMTKAHKLYDPGAWLKGHLLSKLCLPKSM